MANGMDGVEMSKAIIQAQKEYVDKLNYQNEERNDFNVALHVQKNFQIVGISSFFKEQDNEEYLKTGIERVIQKPVTLLKVKNILQ